MSNSVGSFAVYSQREKEARVGLTARPPSFQRPREFREGVGGVREERRQSEKESCHVQELAIIFISDRKEMRIAKMPSVSNSIVDVRHVGVRRGLAAR